MNSAVELESPRPRGLELIYGALFRPDATLDGATMERAFGVGLGVVALLGAVYALTAGVTGVAGTFLAFLTYVGWTLLFWLVPTGALFVVTRAMRREGEIGALLAATALSMLPFLFAAPLAVVGQWGTFGAVVALIGLIGVVVWSVRILLAGIRGVTGLSTGQSVLALFVSQTILMTLPLLMLVLTVMSIATLAG